MADIELTEEEREQQMAENRLDMEKVKKHYQISRVYDIVVNLVVLFISATSLLFWFTSAGYNVRMRSNMANAESDGAVEALISGDIDTQEDLQKATSITSFLNPSGEPERVEAEAIFPPYVVTLIIAPLVVLAVFFADVLSVKKTRWIPFVLYGLVLLFAVADFVLVFEPVPIKDLVILFIYSVLGLASRYNALKTVNEDNRLSKFEGYPDFIYIVHAGSHSEYVKSREAWLKKERNYGKAPKPAENYSVISSDSSDEMDGISLNEDAGSNWFDEDKRENKPAADYSDMDGLAADPSLLPDDSEYTREDTRHRPL